MLVIISTFSIWHFLYKPLYITGTTSLITLSPYTILITSSNRGTYVNLTVSVQNTAELYTYDICIFQNSSISNTVPSATYSNSWKGNIFTGRTSTVFTTVFTQSVISFVHGCLGYQSDGGAHGDGTLVIMEFQLSGNIGTTVYFWLIVEEVRVNNVPIKTMLIAQSQTYILYNYDTAQATTAIPEYSLPIMMLIMCIVSLVTIKLRKNIETKRND